MRLAQWMSTAICCVYILILTYAFRTDAFGLDETAIIDLMQVVAPVLPLLLLLAALSAQFGAVDLRGRGASASWVRWVR